MRKTLLTLTALAGLIGAGAAASAAPVVVTPHADGPHAGGLVQTVQYYGGGYGWREREHRHHEWERHRRWVEWHRWHHHRGW